MIKQDKNQESRHFKKSFLVSLLAVSFVIPMTLGSVGCSNPNAVNNEEDFSYAGEKLINKNFLAYYRTWRDKAMIGIDESNWMTMDEIPYGINIVNVFHYLDPEDEPKGESYFKKLAEFYAPNLRKRGIKLIRGFNYNNLFMLNEKDFRNQDYEEVIAIRKISKPDYEGDYPTAEQVQVFAKELIKNLMVIGNTDVSVKLDGLDIDMEQDPDARQVGISNEVIRALAKHLGPQSENKDSLFLYDTNGENLNPFQEVADCFSLFAYQQYGSDSSKTRDDVLPTYQDLIGKGKIMPGQTFPEENDPINRWHDASFPYESSNIADVAKFVNKNDLGGMFVYALDRDGRNYEDDISTIRPSNMLWTKTAILEANGVSLSTARELTLYHLSRVQYRLHLSKPIMTKIQTEIAAAKNLLEINACVMGYDYPEAISPTYDPILENDLLFNIDLQPTFEAINQARQLINDRVKNFKEVAMMKHELEELIGAKLYTQTELEAALNNLLKTFASNSQ